MAKILVLHNDNVRLKKFFQAFALRSHDFIFTQDGSYGLTLFEEEEPDCVVVDTLLSGRPGTELAKIIRQSERGQVTPVILTSLSFNRTMNEEQAREKLGVDRYFRDPYDLKELVETAEMLIAEYQSKPYTPPPKPEPEPEPEDASEEDFEPEEEPAPAPTKAPAPQPVIELPAEPEPEDEDDVAKALEAAASEFIQDDDLMELFGKKGDPAAEKKSAPRKPAPAPKPKPKPAPAPVVKTLVKEMTSVGRVDSVPAQGDLEQMGVPELFATFYIQNLNGTVEFSNDAGASKKIMFSNGIPVHATGESREETLGRVLVKHGMIDEETVITSLEKMAAEGIKQGGALRDMGAITAAQLTQGLKLQFKEKLLSLFAWQEGEFEYHPGRVDLDDINTFIVDPVKLILDGLEENIRPDLVNRIFQQTKHASIRVLWEDQDFARFSLTEECVTILNLIDGERTVPRIVKESGLKQYKAGIVLYTLWLLGAYEQVETAEIPVSGQESVEHDELDVFDGLMPDDEIPVPVTQSGEAAEFGFPETDNDENFDEDDEAELELEIDSEPEPTPAPAPEPVSADAAEADPAADPRNISELNKAFENLKREMEERKARESERKRTASDAKSDSGISEGDQTIRDQILDDFCLPQEANYYEILRLERGCSQHLIKERHRELVRTIHPDKLRDRFDEELVEKATSVMARITRAYHTLADPKRRRDYDKRLSPEGIETKERHISHILIAEHEFTVGLADLNRGAFERAKDHFQKAADAFPEESSYHAYLGWAIYNSDSGDLVERSTKATPYINRAIKINPKADMPYYFLGVILRDNGYLDRAARSFLQAYSHSDKKNKQAEEELVKIRARLATVQRRKQAARKEDAKSSMVKVLTGDFSLRDLFKKKK